jgi:hypothetical protein
MIRRGKNLSKDLLRGELQGAFPVLPFIIEPIEEFRRKLVKERLDSEDVHSSVPLDIQPIHRRSKVYHSLLIEIHKSDLEGIQSSLQCQSRQRVDLEASP